MDILDSSSSIEKESSRTIIVRIKICDIDGAARSTSNLMQSWNNLLTIWLSEYTIWGEGQTQLIV